MKHFLLFFYTFALFSGFIGIAIVFLLFAQRMKKLAFIYGIFVIGFLILLLSILSQYYCYVILSLQESYEDILRNTLFSFLSKMMFLVGCGMVMKWLFERKVIRKIGFVILFLATEGIFFGTVAWILRAQFPSVLPLVDQWIGGPLLVLTVGITLGCIAFAQQPNTHQEIRKLIRILTILTLLFLPFFLIDALWEVFQLKWKILPRYTNFSPLYFILWNSMSMAFLLKMVIQQNIYFHSLIANIPTSFDNIPLTTREREIVKCLVQGDDNPTIAKKLFLSEHTIRNYISSLYTKTSTSNRVQLVETLRSWLEKQAS